MYVRLAFAVAAHLEPEILIVDEVLAVGDAAFQQKCLGQLERISQRSHRTILLVSHNLSVVARVCHRALLLREGLLYTQGPCRRVIDHYMSTDASDILQFRRPIDLRTANRWGGTGKARLVSVEAIDPHRPNRTCAQFSNGDITFRIQLDGELEQVKSVAVEIYDMTDRKLINANSYQQMPQLKLTPRSTIDITIRDIRLRPGKYKLGFWVGDRFLRTVDAITNACILEVLPHAQGHFDEQHEGVFYCPFDVTLTTS
jgi:lipopolysaccharide transport system ATP-binding protein